MDLEQTRDAILKELSQHSPLTIKYLSRKLNESRKKIKYVLLHNTCFMCEYRTPHNTLSRRRPIWSILKDFSTT